MDADFDRMTTLSRERSIRLDLDCIDPKMMSGGEEIILSTTQHILDSTSNLMAEVEPGSVNLISGGGDK